MLTLTSLKELVSRKDQEAEELKFEMNSLRNQIKELTSNNLSSKLEELENKLLAFVGEDITPAPLIDSIVKVMKNNPPMTFNEVENALRAAGVYKLNSLQTTLNYHCGKSLQKVATRPATYALKTEEKFSRCIDAIVDLLKRKGSLTAENLAENLNQEGYTFQAQSVRARLSENVGSLLEKTVTNDVTYYSLASNKQTLIEAVLEVMKNNPPMSAKTISEEVLKSGYQTSSNNFMNVVCVCLNIHLGQKVKRVTELHVKPALWSVVETDSLIHKILEVFKKVNQPLSVREVSEYLNDEYKKDLVRATMNYHCGKSLSMVSSPDEVPKKYSLLA